MVSFSIERPGYEPIAFSDANGSVFGLGSGTHGLSIGDVVNSIREGAASGGVLLGQRIGTGSADIDVRVVASSEGDMDGHMSRLAALVMGSDPLPAIVARYPDGEVLERTFVYESGLEGHRERTGGTFHKAIVGVRFLGAYWSRRRPESFEARMVADVATPFLDDVAVLPVSGAEIIADMVLTNPGVADSPVSWVVSGPASGDTVIRIRGRGFTILGPLAEGERIFVDSSKPGVPVVTDQTGASRYDLVGPAPKFPKLPKGDSLVELSMEGAEAGVRTATAAVEVENHATNPRFYTDLSGVDFPVDPAKWGRVDAGGHGAAGFTDTDSVKVPHAVVWNVLPTGSHVSVGFEGSGDGQHSFIFFYVEDSLREAVYSTDMTIAGAVIPDGCNRIEAGVAFLGGQGNVSKPILTLTPLSTAYFDGGSVWCGWTGVADESTSVRFVTELVGGSSITGSFQPLKEVVY